MLGGQLDQMQQDFNEFRKEISQGVTRKRSGTEIGIRKDKVNRGPFVTKIAYSSDF